MLQGKYIDLGFEITKFGIRSMAIRFNKKPIFVFNPSSNIDSEFLQRICDTYLKISENRASLSCIKTG